MFEVVDYGYNLDAPGPLTQMKCVSVAHGLN